MDKFDRSFEDFRKENKVYLWLAVIIGIVYFIILRILYPVPSFFTDSFAYIDAAAFDRPASFRPIQYSRMLNLFRSIAPGDIALIIAHYAANLIANLALFFTFIWCFPLPRISKTILFVLLIVNPFYVLYSNYVSPDAFFNAFTVLWFTLLIWIMHQPRWYLIVLHVAILLLLFRLRYNAIVFPAVTASALIMSRLSWVRKIITFCVIILLLAFVIIDTKKSTGRYTETYTFSAFSGWQMANNALHVLRHERVDTTEIIDPQSRTILSFSQHYFDTCNIPFPDSIATAVYLWTNTSPLRKYMGVYPGRKDRYFKTWTALGPVYNNFGKEVIIKRPVAYLQHFIVPNIKSYFLPELEVYTTYSNNRAKLPGVVTEYYKYITDEIPYGHPLIYKIFFLPWTYIFPLLNFLFIGLAAWYVIRKRYKTQPLLFNKMLICFISFFLINFVFIVVLAPTVFRYHVFMVTLLYPVILLLLDVLLKDKRLALIEADKVSTDV